MSLLEQVVTGETPEPARILVYGPDKVGKSEFGNSFPDPIFADLEGKAGGLRPAPPRLHIHHYGQLEGLVTELTDSKHGYQTLVVDTLDWLEPLIWKVVVGIASKKEGKGVTSIEDVGGGYKKGYTEANDVWRDLLRRLEALQRTRGMHVVLLAHSTVKTHKDPQGGDYGRIRTSLYGSAEDLIMQWVKAVCYATFEEAKTKKGKLAKRYGYGQKRFLFCNWHPAYRSGNNYGLPDRLPLDAQAILEAVKSEPVVDPNLLAAIAEAVGFLSKKHAQAARREVEDHKEDPTYLLRFLSRVKAFLDDPSHSVETPAGPSGESSEEAEGSCPEAETEDGAHPEHLSESASAETAGPAVESEGEEDEASGSAEADEPEDRAPTADDELIECTHCSDMRKRPIRHKPPQCETEKKKTRKKKPIGKPKNVA